MTSSYLNLLLWLDHQLILNTCGGMFSDVLVYYLQTFSGNKSDGILNCLNEIDMFCLIEYFFQILTVLFTPLWNDGTTIHSQLQITKHLTNCSLKEFCDGIWSQVHILPPMLHVIFTHQLLMMQLKFPGVHSILVAAGAWLARYAKRDRLLWIFCVPNSVSCCRMPPTRVQQLQLILAWYFHFSYLLLYTIYIIMHIYIYIYMYMCACLYV